MLSLQLQRSEVYFVRSTSYSDRTAYTVTMNIGAEWVTHDLAFEVLPRCRYVKD